MRDGFTTDELKVVDISATGSGTFALLSGATTAVGAGEIGNAELAASACSGNKVDVTFPTAYTGSPFAGGNTAQFGTGTLGAGSSVWVVFGKAFAGTPQVTLTHHDGATTGVWVASGTRGVGSFQAAGATASRAFSWIALGSGR